MEIWLEKSTTHRCCSKGYFCYLFQGNCVWNGIKDLNVKGADNWENERKKEREICVCSKENCNGSE